MWNGPTEILTGQLWLGPCPVSLDGSQQYHTATLQEVGITHVVNCTPVFPFPTASDASSQFRVPVPDDDNAPIQDYFDRAAEFIHTAITHGGRVYVHCETGKSRSATVTLAYRVSKGCESLRVAYYDTKAKRPYIQPKVVFFEHLVANEPRWLNVSSPSFSIAEYSLIYLKDHFAPYAWAGIDDSVVDRTWSESSQDYAATLKRLEVAVLSAME